MKKVTITRPNGNFGSAITETTIQFPAQRLTIEEAASFIEELSAAMLEVARDN